MEENLNINQSIEKNNNVNETPKKKKKKKHRFLKILLFILIIFIGIKVFGIVKNYYEEKEFSKLVKEHILVNEIEEIELTEEELQQDSNGDGLTNKEKIDRGLDILSDDTDGDGLKDYDEIYKYNSDPTKFSTSGDLFSDAEKVQRGYDINKVYNEPRKIEINNDKILLTPNEATDMQAYYKEYIGTVPNKYTFGMQPFRVYSFTGQAEIKIDNPKYYEVISYDSINKKETKIKHKTTDESIVFDIINDNPILIVYKQSILRKLSGNAMSNINVNVNRESEYIVIICPLANILVDVPIYIYEVNDNFFKNNNSNTVLQKTIESKLGNGIKVEYSYINSVGAKFVNLFLKWFDDEVTTYYDQQGFDKSFINYILIYKRFNDSASMEKYLYGNNDSEIAESENSENDSEENIIYEFEEKYNNTSGEYYADSGFSVIKNAFRFANLVTPRSNGVCMGFAHITSSIYNNANFDKVKQGVYDLTDGAFNCIWNKDLYSYIPESDELAAYADDISGNETVLEFSDMPKPDSEVVKALEYYYETINEKTRTERANCLKNKILYREKLIEQSTIDNVINEFKNRNIVIAVLWQKNKSQHAINAYKIVEDSNDPDILYLKVYDNNLPGDMFWNSSRTGKIKYDVTITLQRKYKKSSDGQEIIEYAYDYNPIDNKDYHYGNIDRSREYLLFFDENGNVL